MGKDLVKEPFLFKEKQCALNKWDIGERKKPLSKMQNGSLNSF